MNGFENHAGFNITSTKLQVVEVTGESGKIKLSNLTEVFFDIPLDFNKDKETILLAKLQSAYDELKISSQLISKTISVALPLKLFLIIQVPFDNTLLYWDLLEEFRWELSVLYPHIHPDELSIQYFEIEKNMYITKSTAIVSAIPRKYIELIANFCKSNNLKLRFIDSAHFAAERSVILSDKAVTDGLTLSVHISENSTSVLYALDFKPIYTNVCSTKSDKEIITFIEEELSKETAHKINRDFISCAYISGESVTTELKHKLEYSAGIKFSKFNPFFKIDSEPIIKNKKIPAETFNSFAPAAGIAYRTD
jgi:Tfp pilus assembly PilM family ATPase